MSRGLCTDSYVASVLAWLVLYAATVSAQDIAFTSGSLVEIAPPTSVEEGALEDSGTAVIFAERQRFLLASDLSVDATNPGAEVNASGIGGDPGLISAGTLVDSYLVHFDPVGQPTDLNVTAAWSVGFESTNRILGLIYSDALLDASDFLGAPGTAYPTGLEFRGTTGSSEGNDSLLWSQFTAMSGLQSVTVAVDQVRVIVAASEPVSVLLTLPALLAFGMLRRKTPELCTKQSGTA
jgi:hypothetical protein